ncbi:MAG: DegT/DnrJ/EryC1/StrS family aminotransferase [Bacteroidetes bacterium]|nr:DegT/DnrJ/EryC1/StrS family aminotransferase [Bacteroidota bacterium]MCH8943056.1 DegT/DnrJ/EryC1/StrS family aminotransferase [Bacteroidota bacterium]
MKVPLLNLKLQYQAHKNELDKAVLRVVESQYFILGPEVDEMEKAFCGYLNCNYAVGVSSGTDALLLALMAIGIKSGNEVIVPTYSFFSTAGVISRLNATPVFVDINKTTFNIDSEDIKRKITEKTKAIIPVHLYGQSCEMDEIVSIAKEHKLKIIEDAAQAIGTQYKDGRYVGTIGDIGCFSFFPSKNLGCYGDGGLAVTNDPELAERLKIMRVHGAKPRYYHKTIGGNFRLDALQAAVLNVKLPYLNSWSAKRRTNADLYNKLFIEAGLTTSVGETEFNDNNKVLLPKAVYREYSETVKNYNIYNQYIIRVQKRDELRKHLSDNEIGNEIYYPVPFHLQECFSNLNYKQGDFPNAEEACATSLALPIFPELTEEQIKYVVDTIRDFIYK